MFSVLLIRETKSNPRGDVNKEGFLVKVSKVNSISSLFRVLLNQ